LLKKRLSKPKAVTVVATAAVVAAAVSVAPSFAGPSFLTSQKASKTYVTNKKASTTFLKKKAAGNLYVAKKTAPYAPVAGIAAGSAPYGPTAATTAGYIPTAFTSFAVKTNSKAVITFSGNAICTAAKPSPELACPIEILVDGQKTGKVNFAPATAESSKIVPNVQTVMETTFLQKGGHTVAVQYLGAKNVTFTLSGWNLSAETYPEPREASEETTSTAPPSK
jgi:hypothetical protein